MKDITDLRTTHIRLYQIDTIPLQYFYSDRNINKIKSLFKFKRIEPALGLNKDVAEINFYGGEYIIDKKPIIIEHLFIELKKIFLKIIGDSKTNEQIFKKLLNVIAEVDPNNLLRKSKPILIAYESSCVVTLDIDSWNIFSSKFLKFLNTDIKKATSVKYGKNEIVLHKLSLKITYLLQDEVLNKNKITLSDKFFEIEPRATTPLELKRFYTFSPTDSDTLLFLVEEFEKKFSQKTK